MLNCSTGCGALRVRAAGARVLSPCPQGPQMMCLACFALTLMTHTLALQQVGGFNAESDIAMGCFDFMVLLYSPGWACGTLRSMVRTWLWLLEWPLLLCHRVVAGQILRVFCQLWGVCVLDFGEALASVRRVVAPVAHLSRCGSPVPQLAPGPV